MLFSHVSISQAFGAAWVTFLLVWIAALGISKPQARTIPTALRLFQSVVLILGYLFIFNPHFRQGWLGARIWPQSDALALAGLAITWAGVLFAIWARFTLGSNWSARPMVKVDHQLVESGPYRLVRHPIYTGLLLAGAGSALAIGRWCILPGMAFVLLGLMMKMTQEERLMTETFPAHYPDYRQRVKAIVPFVF